MNYRDSVTITQLLFGGDRVNAAGRLANSMLFSVVDPRAKFKMLLGRGGDFSNAEGKFPEESSVLTSQENPILVSNVIAACIVAHSSDVSTLCEVIMWAQSESLKRVVRQGLILGLIRGGALIGSAKVPNYEQDIHLLDRVLKLAWHRDEDNKFLNEVAGELNDQVAKFVKGAGEPRRQSLAKFLKDAAFQFEREGGYPSPGAKQVITEFEHKIISDMEGAQSLMVLAKGLQADLTKAPA